MKTILATLVLSLSCTVAASNCKDDILSAQGETMIAMAKGNITTDYANMVFKLQEMALETCNQNIDFAANDCQKSQSDLSKAAGLTALARHTGKISRKQSKLISEMQATARYTLELYCSQR